jgi:hypothetical protein
MEEKKEEKKCKVEEAKHVDNDRIIIKMAKGGKTLQASSINEPPTPARDPSAKPLKPKKE